MGNFLSLPGVFGVLGVRGGSGEGVLVLLGARVYEPGASGDALRTSSGAGQEGLKRDGLKGVAGDMRRGLKPDSRRATVLPRVVLAVLCVDVLLPVRECPCEVEECRVGGGASGWLPAKKNFPLAVRDSTGGTG